MDPPNVPSITICNIAAILGISMGEVRSELARLGVTPQVFHANLHAVLRVLRRGGSYTATDMAMSLTHEEWSEEAPLCYPSVRRVLSHMEEPDRVYYGRYFFRSSQDAWVRYEAVPHL